jgi:hypothetical protein
VWEETEEPLQVVHERVEVEIEELDWRGEEEGKEEERLERWLRADRRRGFEYWRAPLMRMTLIRVGAEVSYFVWSHHHLLLDGWSLRMLLKELFECYGVYRMEAGAEVKLEKRRAYKEYIEWLGRQSAEAAEEYWRERLKGYEGVRKLGRVDAVDEEKGEAEWEVGENKQRWSREQTREVQQWCREQQLTLNTVVQGAWGLVMSRRSGEKEAVFGAVVAGRPAGLAGAERMIGLFINTLPVRVKVAGEEEVRSWLQRLQAEQVEAREYEYSRLWEVQKWGGMSSGEKLFESVVVFENYPAGAAAELRDSGVEVQEVRTVERTHYEMALVVVPSERMEFKLGYDTRSYDDQEIGELLLQLQRVILQIVRNPRQRVSEISITSEAEVWELSQSFSEKWDSE